MTLYVLSGFKTVEERMYRNRIKLCDECVVDGTKIYDEERNVCKVCGCRIKGDSGYNSKARLPHQRCPIGKW